MAVVAFPSYAYNSAGQPAVVVNSQAAFAALPLPGTWAFTPYTSPTGTPADPNFSVTDTRLQQLLVESRMQSMMLAQAFGVSDDPIAVLRPDILANDSSLTS